MYDFYKQSAARLSHQKGKFSKKKYTINQKKKKKWSYLGWGAYKILGGLNLPCPPPSPQATALDRTQIYEQISSQILWSECKRWKIKRWFSTAPGRWIGRGGPIVWLPRSTDFSCLDFFLRGRMKSLIYECSIKTDMDLVARFAVVAGITREIPGAFANISQSLSRRCKACITADGRSFEHVITFLLIKCFLKYLLSFLC